jgi:predicted aldo/keto reductase-like oxidoreductase
VVTAALAGSTLKSEAASDKPSIRSYGEIGKTGLRMSDISMGSSRLTSPSLLLRAIDRGINYIDTSPDYGQAEKYIGQAMKKIKRDKIIIASKFCRTREKGGHLKLGSRKKDYIAVVDDSLSRMKTDHLDICFIHSAGSVSKDLEDEKRRMLDEEMLSAADSLRKAGKIRFIGVSSHGPNNMEELLMIAVRSGQIDVIMPAFNFMMFPDLPGVLRDARDVIAARQKKKRSLLSNLDLLKEAHKRGVGVIAMKTLAGERDLNYSSKGVPFQPAAFKWVLSHPEVSGLVVTIKSVAQLDLYISASGQRFDEEDRRVLEQYMRRYSKEYCRTGCNRCESGCPNGVSIATSLRYRMYFSDYGMEKRAMESYAVLTNDAGACLECEEEFCAGACPYGLPLRALLSDTHETLSFRT